MLPRDDAFDDDAGDYRAAGAPVYHNLQRCPEGRAIPADERQYGSGGLPLCPTCKRIRDDRMRHDTFA
jgi:hypothetical protein